MLVSIVINNYNYGRFLGPAIRSALDQTYPDIEVIVVDDGSTDDSRAVIESFGPKVKSIFKENGGQGSTYNVGFAVSSGELIHYLDSDDLLHPTAIEEVVKVWTPGVTKVQFYLQVIEGLEGIPTGAIIPSGKLSNGNIRERLLKIGNYTSPPASGNCYSRELLAKVLPMPESDWRTAADMFTIFNAALAGEIKSISRPLGLYRVHGSNMDAQTMVTGKLLRYRLSKEAKRDELLADYCRKSGLDYKDGSVSNHIDNAKIRLASLLVDREGHPYKDDTVISLFRRCVAICLANPSFSNTKKAIFCVWLAALVLSPKGIQPNLLTLGFSPAKRPKMFQKFLAPAPVAN